MLNLNFYSFKEKTPPHGMDIYYFKKDSSWGSETRELKSDTVEYMWDNEDGSSAIFEESPILYNVGDADVDGYKLIITVDGWTVNDEDYWISDDDFWPAFDKAHIKEN